MLLFKNKKQSFYKLSFISPGERGEEWKSATKRDEDSTRDKVKLKAAIVTAGGTASPKSDMSQQPPDTGHSG